MSMSEKLFRLTTCSSWLTAIIGDVNFRVALLNKQDAVRQIRQIKSTKILEGLRGMQPVDI